MKVSDIVLFSRLIHVNLVLLESVRYRDRRHRILSSSVALAYMILADWSVWKDD